MRYYIPLLIFLVVAGFLLRGLELDPKELPSALINRPAPDFVLKSLDDDASVSIEDYKGQVVLLNVWATWCGSCKLEHRLLMEIAQASDVTLIGLVYKDSDQAASEWLKTYGNPYEVNVLDSDGRVAIDYGVYGTPETFVIDAKGIIRHKHIGPLDAQSWEQNIRPMIAALNKEGSTS